MSQVRHFQQSALQFQSYGGQDIERAAICRLIGPADSETMGAGLARFDGVSIEWTVLYDELIVVLEGNFRLRLADQVIEARPGDVIWVPERTPLAYEGEKPASSTPSTRWTGRRATPSWSTGCASAQLRWKPARHAHLLE